MRKQDSAGWETGVGADRVNEEADSNDVFSGAAAAYDAGEFTRAASLWGSLVDKPDAIFNAGNASRDAGDAESAERYYRIALEGGVKDAYINYAYLLLDSDRRPETLEVLSRGAADGDDFSGVQYARELLEKNPIESERVAQQLAGVDSLTEQNATLIVAQARLATNPSDSSVERLLRSVPSLAEAQLELASYLVEQKNFDEAQAILSDLLDSGDPSAGLPLGNLLWDERDDTDAAEVAYRRGIELGDNFSRFNLGLMLWEINREEEGEALIREASRQGDTFADKWLENH